MKNNPWRSLIDKTMSFRPYKSWKYTCQLKPELWNIIVREMRLPLDHVEFWYTNVMGDRASVKGIILENGFQHVFTADFEYVFDGLLNTGWTLHLDKRIGKHCKKQRGEK